ncbi:MAG TPA: porin [Paludibacter sp.]|jgi:hypothetical protein|nr:porin [Paludibacter sp.]HPM10322.1 porin [Paludibacter sp.]
MKKNYVLTIVLILTCFWGHLSGSSLFAQSSDEIPKSVDLSLHLRPAYHAQFNGTPLEFENGGFKFDHIIVDVGGQVTPKLSYRYLQRLNKVSPIFIKENLPSTIDYAYLKYALNNLFSITAGKQALSVGGFEYNKYPVDVYDYSGISNYITCYLTGMQVAFTPVQNQEFSFQIVNNRMGTWREAIGTPQIGSQLEAPTLPLYYSLGWNSNYLNNALQLRYAANITSPAKGKTLVMVSGGQMWQSGPFSIYIDAFFQHSEIDYLGGIRNLTIGPQNVVENVNYFSLLGEANYRIQPQWNILLKCFYNNFSTYKSSIFLDKGNCLTSWNYQGGIEFYPMKDDNLHLFLIATFKNYLEPAVAQVIAPDDSFRISAGFIYRIPIVSLKR